MAAIDDLNAANAADISPALIFQHDDGTIGAWFLRDFARERATLFDPPNPGGANWRIATRADFDGDGDMDLLWQNSDGSIALWYLDGVKLVSARSFQPPGPGSPQWKLVGCKDFSGDGNPDLLWQHVDGTVAVWTMEKERLSTASLLDPSHPGDADWRVVGVGDFNRDSHPDILWQHKDGSLAQWIMNGKRLQGAQYLEPAKASSSDWKAVDVWDVNQDGYPDIIFRNSAGALAIWHMKGRSLDRAGIVGPSNPDAGWKLPGEGTDEIQSLTAVAIAEPSPANGGQSVALDGSSSLPYGRALSYHWRQTGGPLVTINNANQAVATFVAPESEVTQTLQFILDVSHDQVRSSAETRVVINPVDNSRTLGLLPGLQVEPALTDKIVVGALPPLVDLSGDMPNPGNQGRQGSCVGWALGYYVMTYVQRQDRGWPLTPEHVFSPSFVYNLAKSSGDCSVGARFDTAFKVLEEQGCAPLSSMPYNADDCTTPTAAQISLGQPYKLYGIRRIDLLNEHEVKTFITAKRPVVLGIKVHTDFERLSTQDPVYDTLAGSFRGYHAVVIVGYDDSARRYKLVNSWGTTWGQSGFFYIPYDFLNKAVYSSSGYVAFGRETKDPRPVQADLVIGNFTPPSELAPGQRFEALYVVRNAGQAGTPVFNVIWYLSRDSLLDASDRQLASPEGMKLPGLSRTSDTLKQLMMPDANDSIWLGSGTYYLLMKVDTNETVPEADENNNFASRAVKINGIKPPFEVAAFQISHVGRDYGCSTGAIPLSSIRPGRNVRAYIKLKNNTAGNADIRLVNFRADRDQALPYDTSLPPSSGEYLGANGGTAEYTRDFQVSEAGTYNITFDLEQLIGGGWERVPNFSFPWTCAFNVSN